MVWNVPSQIVSLIHAPRMHQYLGTPHIQESFYLLPIDADSLSPLGQCCSSNHDTLCFLQLDTTVLLDVPFLPTEKTLCCCLCGVLWRPISLPWQWGLVFLPPGFLLFELPLVLFMLSFQNGSFSLRNREFPTCLTIASVRSLYVWQLRFLICGCSQFGSFAVASSMSMVYLSVLLLVYNHL